MDNEQIKAKLIELIDENSDDLGIDASKVDTTADLSEVYGFTSIQLIRLILEAEKAFNVSFTDKELAFRHYRNFDDLIDKIAEKLREA